MKDLSKFDQVKKALEQVASESSVDNGTSNATFLAHFWEQEEMWDSNRSELELGIGKAMLSGNIDKIKPLQDQLAALPRPKIIMVWRLINKIPMIKGTKVVYDGEKAFSPSMNNVEFIHIPEDAIKMGLLEYEETDAVMTDKLGRESKVLELHLKRGMIDVKEATVDRKGKVIRQARAYVTAISFKALQVAGKVMYNENETKRKMFGMDENI